MNRTCNHVNEQLKAQTELVNKKRVKTGVFALQVPKKCIKLIMKADPIVLVMFLPGWNTC